MARLTPLWQQNSEFPASLDRRLIEAIWPSGGVRGMAPTVVPGTRTIRIAAGAAAVPSTNGTGNFLCVTDAVEEVDVPAAGAAGSNRYDLIVVRPRDSAISAADNDFIFDVVAGPPSATPPVPGAPPAGTIALARVYVQGGDAFLIATNLTDIRIPLDDPTGRELAFAWNGNGQTGIQTAPVDLNGLAAPAFTLTSRRRIELFANIGINKAATDQAQWNLLVISNMANVNQASAYFFLTAPGWAMCTIATSLTLDPGTYQYKCRAQTAAGFLNVTAGSNSMIRVRDLGPA